MLKPSYPSLEKFLEQMIKENKLSPKMLQKVVRSAPKLMQNLGKNNGLIAQTMNNTLSSPKIPHQASKSPQKSLAQIGLETAHIELDNAGNQMGAASWGSTAVVYQGPLHEPAGAIRDRKSLTAKKVGKRYNPAEYGIELNQNANDDNKPAFNYHQVAQELKALQPKPSNNNRPDGNELEQRYKNIPKPR